MAESYVQVPADGSGKKTRTHIFTIGANEVHQQIIETADFATQLIVDSVYPDISYAGKALAGSATSSAVWQIKKINESSGVVITWADGNTDYDNIFNNRESLSYS